VLLNSSHPQKYIKLIQVISHIRAVAKGLLMVCYIVPGKLEDMYKKFFKLPREEFFIKNGIKGHLIPIIAPDFRTGAEMAFQCIGLNRLRPNTIVLPYLSWKKSKDEEQEEYVNMVRDYLSLSKAIMIVRDNDIDLIVKKFGYMDVWWLVDDGGLTLLIPYVFHQKELWNKCEIRVFSIAGDPSRSNQQLSSMNKMIQDFRMHAKVEICQPNEEIETDDIIQAMEKKLDFELSEVERELTRRFLLLRDLLILKSKESQLVFITLPLPKMSVNHKVWLAWLDLLSNGMPPVFFIRGNNENVLTLTL